MSIAVLSVFGVSLRHTRVAFYEDVRSDRSASSESKQNYLARERWAFCNGSVLNHRHLRGKSVGRVDLRVDRGH